MNKGANNIRINFQIENNFIFAIILTHGNAPMCVSPHHIQCGKERESSRVLVVEIDLGGQSRGHAFHPVRPDGDDLPLHGVGVDLLEALAPDALHVVADLGALLE